MAKEKQVQISQTLFIELVKYHLMDHHEPSQEGYIKTELKDKLDAIVKHDLYTQYKSAPTEEEREKARQQYLDKVGISTDFRW